MIDSIFKIPLFLFYDNAENKKKAGLKRGDDNISMFLKTHLISFSDEKYAKNWICEEMANEKFSFSVNKSLLEKYKCGGEKENDMIYRALSLINEVCQTNQEIITIKAHHSKSTNSLYEEYADGTYRWKYHYVEFSPLLVRKLSRLFVSTIIFNAQKIKWPVNANGEKQLPEGMMIEFNMDSHEASLVDISVYSSSQIIPFQNYINTVLNQIWDEIDKAENKTKEDREKAVDYYKLMKIDKEKDWGIWCPVSKLDEALATGAIAPFGVYMLYNSQKKTFYVGKANEVYSRMDSHRKNKSSSEPMPEFDFFRFSLVAEEHWDELFLIENAAIHDCAAIFNMPNAKTGRLEKISLQKHVTTDLNNIVMTNTDEAQTKWNKQ